MSFTLRCPCGRLNRVTGRRARCWTCGRVLTRPAGRRRLAVALALVAAAVGGLTLLAKSPSADPPAPPDLAAAPAARPAPAADLSFRPTSDDTPRSSADATATPAPTVPPQPVPRPDRPPPPATGLMVSEAAARFRVGEAFDQEVTVSRRSAFRVLGADVAQAAEYAFTSRLTIEAVGPDGSLVARQRVETTRLIDCDPTMRAAMEDALTKARGATFEIAVGPGGEVTGLKGPKDPLRVLAGNDPTGGQSLRVWSLLDEDGWRELAGLTFFRPDRPPRAGERWTRPLTHSWGPLGGWYGRTRYAAAGRHDGAERIEYAHEVTYRPPAGGGGELPLWVLRADFKPLAAGGVIRYDAARDRVVAAEEAFRVRGAVVVSAGGAEAAVEMEESQTFRLRLLDPAARVLEGQLPPTGR